MGLIVDSSEWIVAERSGKTARELLLLIRRSVGRQEIAISVITLLELQHGIVRADTALRRVLRTNFLAELMRSVPVLPITASVALRAGQIDGDNTARGLRVPLSDLLLGVTALELGYGVLTSNVRHFQLIPGLEIVTL